jgi:hypothetical protein
LLRRGWRRGPHAIADPGDGFEAEGPWRVAFAQAPNDPDAAIYGVVADGQAAPAALDELVAADNPSLVAGQGHQDLHHPRLQGQSPAGGHDLARGRPDSHGAEIEFRLEAQVDPGRRPGRTGIFAHGSIGNDRQ